MSKKFFTYTTSDKNNVQHFRNNIDGLIINGNIYAYSSKSIKENIIANNIIAIIDPMLYVLQADLKNQLKSFSKNKKDSSTYEKYIKPTKVKHSILKMLFNYGFDISKLEKIYEYEDVNRNTLIYEEIPNVFENKTILKILKNIEMTQKNIWYLSENQSKKSILLDEILKNKKEDFNQYIAPTFIPSSKFFININMQILSLNKYDVIPIYLDKKSLKNDIYISFIKNLYKYKDKEFLLWIESSIKNEFEKIIESINHLLDKPKISIRYAGYKELLICQKLNIKIEKWINAFGYGEERNILPIGGGLPVNKVYSPILHKRLAFYDFYNEVKKINLNKEQYLNKYCGCRTCKELIVINNSLDGLFASYAEQGNPYKWNNREKRSASSKAQKLSTYHFVYNKIIEIDNYMSLPKIEDKISLWENKDKP